MAMLNAALDANVDGASLASSHSTATVKLGDANIPANQPFPQLRNNADDDADSDARPPASGAASKMVNPTRDNNNEDNDDDEDPAVVKPFLRTSTPDNGAGRTVSGVSSVDDDDETYDDGENNNDGGGASGSKNGTTTHGGVDGGERRPNATHERLGHKMHKFTLYETASRYYIVGEDVTGRRFRVLKIDRTASDDGELSVTDDKIVYSRKEMIQLLDTIDDGNRGTGGIKLRCTTWGLLGFIKFTGPYYMMLITKKSTVAVIGGHVIYQIAGTELIPLTPGRGAGRVEPTGGSSGGGSNAGGGGNAGGQHGSHNSTNSAEEARFLGILNHINLTQSFYFSYSYDITHTLQHNITKEREALAQGRRWSCDEHHNAMFVWNSHLLQPAVDNLASPFDWCRPITHGYIDQASISIYGRTAYVAIIARRSRYFAGARFLKRGANDLGYVANDVETEQIVSEASTTSFHSPGRRLFANPQYTSYVQHRGSIPLYWTQENTGVTPKPPIELNLVDPFYSAAALHFDNLFERYGAPIYVLNLVKARESTPRESKLLEEFTRAINYLNQFLPADKKIIHHPWDMSRANKSRDVNVIRVLEEIAETVVATTGFFRNGEGDGHVKGGNDEANDTDIVQARLQNGVARTNCIDCLDRTNAAQFVIGKCALGHQLHALGILDEPTVNWETDAVNLFTHMYHDHGDTIAVQYGGSQLVNTMETYRKINQWTSHSRDMLETFKRYYNNSFLDGQRQEAYNLFLGNYIYIKGQPMLWDLPTDYYLHHADPRRRQEKDHRRDYIHWFTPENLRRRTLPPLPYIIPAGPTLSAAAKHSKHAGVSNGQRNGHGIIKRHSTGNSSSTVISGKPLSYFDDYWLEFYRPYFLSSFAKMFTFKIKSTMKYIPIRSTREGQYDLSPFKVRSEIGGHGSTSAEADAAAVKRRGRHKKEVSFVTPEDVAEARLSAGLDDEKDTASIRSGHSAVVSNGSSGGGVGSGIRNWLNPSQGQNGDGSLSPSNFQGIVKDGALPVNSHGGATVRNGWTNGATATAATSGATSTAAATTATTPATILSSSRNNANGKHVSDKINGGSTSNGIHGSEGHTASSYGNATTLDNTLVTNGGLLFEPDPRQKPKQSTIEKLRQAQLTFAKMVEDSLNPSVQETEDYERYISHPQNLQIVVSAEETPASAPMLPGLTGNTPNGISTTSNEKYQQYVNGSWKTDGLGLSTPDTPVFPSSASYKESDELSMYDELLRVPENPLTVTEEDAQKKRYKAYRKWLRGKSLFKQQPVDA